MNFHNKVVIITGAAGGIGKATAALFAEAGAKLALVDLNEKALEAMVTELRLQDYIAIKADVSKEDEVRLYVEKTIEKYGRIDVFFNNAGIGEQVALIIDTTAEKLERSLGVNLKGVFFGLKHVLRVMKKQKSGSIINTSSSAGLRGSPGMSPYVASKHAVIGLTKTAALESASWGVRVNAICPSIVDTPIISPLTEAISPGNSEKGKQMMAFNHPMKRIATPNEIAQVVLFLASEKASYINGSAYRIDGGAGA